MTRGPSGEWTISERDVKKAVAVWSVVAGLMTTMFAVGVAYTTASRRVYDVERELTELRGLPAQIADVQRDVGALVRFRCRDTALEEAALADLRCNAQDDPYTKRQERTR